MELSKVHRRRCPRSAAAGVTVGLRHAAANHCAERLAVRVAKRVAERVADDESDTCAELFAERFPLVAFKLAIDIAIR